MTHQDLPVYQPSCVAAKSIPPLSQKKILAATKALFGDRFLYSMIESSDEFLCSESAPTNVVFATGAAMGHAGEYLQGVIDEGGERHAVLISIPTPELGSRAHFEPDRSGMLGGTSFMEAEEPPRL